jgi:hypothetical protein
MTYYFKLHQNPSPSQQSLFNRLDWKNTIIGGSYALYHLTRPTNWIYNDIDIFLYTNTWEDFVSTTNTYGLKLIKERSKKYLGSKPEIGDEQFHDNILGVRTYEFDEKTVQFVGIKKQYRFYFLEEPFEYVLEKMVDIPSVFLKAPDSFYFYIPKNSYEILLTKSGSGDHICKSRKEKYTQRGYKFF